MEYSRRIGAQVLVLSNAIKRHMSEWTAIASHGELTAMQMWFIHRVYIFSKSGNVFQRDLERSFGISRATASNILKLMEERDLIIREATDADARLKKITLTEHALDLCEQNSAALDRMENALSAGISESDLDIFFRVLSVVSQNLRDSSPGAACKNNSCPEVQSVCSN